MASGNGKAGTRREAFAHNEAAHRRALTQQEKALAALEGSEWEDEITENHIHLPQGRITLEADRTGRLRAVSNPDDEITLTDNGQAPRKTESEPPPKVAKGIGFVLDKLPPGQRWFGLLVLAALVGALLWRGVALW